MNRPTILMPSGELRKRTRRSFLAGGAAAAAGAAGYLWMQSKQDESGVPIAQRRVLDANGALWHDYLSSTRIMPEYPASRVEKLKANGAVGLKDPVADDWELAVVTHRGPALSFTLQDILAMPPTHMVTRFCCIEGWSSIAQWTGVRFADFTRRILPPGSTPPPYVHMSTPDEEYYVGIDTKSALHPQTLLAWELNGQPLTPQHGAPLRLVIPVKYGIKNIKRIGSIEYTDKRPADYWADDGYDWFAGL